MVRSRRSALYVPASNAKAIAKVQSLSCDVVILDLEDSVAPEAKASARSQAVAAIFGGGFGHRELVVRVNGLETEWGREDLAAFAKIMPDAILVPKINSKDGIGAYTREFAGSPVKLWAMVETALSIFHLNEIAAEARGGQLTGFVVGTNDLAKELGAQPWATRLAFVGMLGLAVAAARAHGLSILDGVYNDIEDGEGFVLQANQAFEFGFDGKTLIHPCQIDPCNKIFTPNAVAVMWAKTIIDAFNLPENANKGAIKVEGKMVERLHLEQAVKTLAKATGRAV